MLARFFSPPERPLLNPSPMTKRRETRKKINREDDDTAGSPPTKKQVWGDYARRRRRRCILVSWQRWRSRISMMWLTCWIFSLVDMDSGKRSIAVYWNDMAPKIDYFEMPHKGAPLAVKERLKNQFLSAFITSCVPKFIFVFDTRPTFRLSPILSDSQRGGKTKKKRKKKSE